MKHAKRFLNWLLVNGSFVVLLVAGMQGVEWAGNLGRFLIWSLLLVMLVLCAAIGLAFLGARLAEQKGEPLPKDPSTLYTKLAELRLGKTARTLDTVYDLAMILFLASAGWFATAVAWVLVLGLTRWAWWLEDEAYRRLVAKQVDRWLSEVAT